MNFDNEIVYNWSTPVRISVSEIYGAVVVRTLALECTMRPLTISCYSLILSPLHSFSGAISKFMTERLHRPHCMPLPNTYTGLNFPEQPS
jgi:hypothetical protein